MTTFTDIDSDAPERNAREQLGDIFSALASNSDRILTPLMGVIVGAIALIPVQRSQHDGVHVEVGAYEVENLSRRNELGVQAFVLVEVLAAVLVGADRHEGER